MSHLRSVHYSKVMYDYGRPWVTHASLQTAEFENAEQWLKAWQKPICFDEVMYEGNLNRRWGNLSGRGDDAAFLAGCDRRLLRYRTARPISIPIYPWMKIRRRRLWWSHGGKLHGTSPTTHRLSA